MKKLLSGIKPTGKPHIGNYFGAMKQWVDYQHEYNAMCMIADYHSLNFIQDAKQMREMTEEMLLDFLAIGLDPAKTIIFKQSDICEHTELCWIFDTITTMPYLMRAHAFKDAEAKNKEISVGTFNYPMLMAADILLYGPDIVPVGQDQKQHVEFARDTAEKFNRIFGETFTLPQEKIITDVAVVPGTDGRKMSKSYANTIGLFATDEEIQKSVMSIVTDSSGGKPENVYAIHALLKPKDELDKLYAENEGKYKALKEALIEDLKTFIKPMRDKREELAKDRSIIKKVLEDGAKKAKEQAQEKMKLVRKMIGVSE